MQSLLEWRIRKIHEIAVAVNPEDIIKGAPTLDSVKEGIWGQSKIPPNIPTTEAEPIANGEKQIPEERDDELDYCEPDSTAPSINSGGLASQPPAITYQPRSRLPSFRQSKPLGYRGMGYVGASTFNGLPTKAGETPTISHGMPVGGPTGQFGAI